MHQKSAPIEPILPIIAANSWLRQKIPSESVPAMRRESPVTEFQSNWQETTVHAD